MLVRKPQYRDLPPHLYWNGSVFRYRKPDGVEVSLGTDRRQAIEAAKRANSILYPRDMYSRIMGEIHPPMKKILQRYWDEFLSTGGRYSAKSLKDLRHKTNVLIKEWGHLYPEALSVLIVAAFVDRFPPRQSERYAGYLRKFFRWCVSKGYLTRNLAADLITKPVKRQRQRLSLEGYWAVYEHAEPWLQRAMNLALQSLMRREDLVLRRFDEYQDGKLPYRQLKTGTYVMIEVGPELDRAIRDCRDDVLSPFMVHKRPTRITSKSKALREHHTQVLEDQLTHAFQEARDRSGFYRDLEEGNPPSFHEIRALGAHLYEKAGIDPQPLLGHKDPATTRIYLDHHEIEWIQAAGGLKL